MPSRPLLIALFALSALAATPDGAALYKSRCSTCHDTKTEARMPSRDDLARSTPETILKAMTDGAMVSQSAGLNDEERRAIARFITGKEFSTTTAMLGQCKASAKPLSFSSSDWNGWGNGIGNPRYQPNPGLSAADVPKLKVKWVFGFPSLGMSQGQPTVVGGRIFVGATSGDFYALDANSGCIYWTVKIPAQLRNSAVVGKVGDHYYVFFGDSKATAHALDADTGKEIWKTKIEDFPQARITGSVVFHDGRLYASIADLEEPSAMNPQYECCKYSGSISSLDAATGKIIWHSPTISQPAKPYKSSSTGTQLYGPAGASAWAAPTIDAKRKRVYVATGNSFTNVDVDTTNAILAFDLETGKLAWSHQVLEKDSFTMACGQSGKASCPEDKGPDFDFGTSPAIRSIGGGKEVLVVGQKSGILWAFDPDNKGAVVWQTRIGNGGALGGIEWGHATDDQQAYAAISDRPKGPGLLSAVNLKTGEKLWTTPTPDTGRQTFISAAISAMPGIVFAGAVDSHFRAYDSKTGTIVWDFDAMKPFETVNGVTAKGGSFDDPGPVIANGMVFTPSGYGMWGGTAGNVLLAFSVDGK